MARLLRVLGAVMDLLLANLANYQVLVSAIDTKTNASGIFSSHMFLLLPTSVVNKSGPIMRHLSNSETRTRAKSSRVSNLRSMARHLPMS